MCVSLAHDLISRIAESKESLIQRAPKECLVIDGHCSRCWGDIKEIKGTRSCFGGADIPVEEVSSFYLDRCCHNDVHNYQHPQPAPGVGALRRVVGFPGLCLCKIFRVRAGNGPSGDVRGQCVCVRGRPEWKGPLQSGGGWVGGGEEDGSRDICKEASLITPLGGLQEVGRNSPSWNRPPR